MSEKQISYNEAYEELQTILEDIKERNIDVDKLAAKVKRARELINLCEERIKKAEMEIEEIIKSSSEKPKN
ncbi:MAG: exodeoxyribonuclease VII small subunit [Candidatus Nealsonbacteria bacterium CG10_big_fil_rev_8_21_14_0_10_36_24]|uniref:Exodeoxyribonuclease VII small subunit n=1 Tax=Candidatus Nealsonbacteria bacterium CG10_big_fil_rev_8_21_14_0_10_36_24 TaxID=1974710 RepID=A0A2M6NR81_9BACT|nr:MAG: exodeoxyribonuclease VII small subunit [Candidatus Nealsonbacteria bacterium CG10_big_fil_rev_8_21_14_0_10_36_24]